MVSEMGTPTLLQMMESEFKCTCDSKARKGTVRGPSCWCWNGTGLLLTGSSFQESQVPYCDLAGISLNVLVHIHLSLYYLHTLYTPYFEFLSSQFLNSIFPIIGPLEHISLNSNHRVFPAQGCDFLSCVFLSLSADLSETCHHHHHHHSQRHILCRDCAKQCIRVIFMRKGFADGKTVV